MLFNSLTFVVFFTVVLILYFLPSPWRVRKSILLITSYIFYAAWNPPLVVLLWISTMVDWYCGKHIARLHDGKRRRLLLMTSIFTNLGLLSYFKYGGFILENFIDVANGAGFEYEPMEWSIVLPVGISFYTFQTLTYTFDIYRRKLVPTTSFLDFALYVTFFPQLVAGPIVRATQFLPQCREAPRVTADQFIWGLLLATLGLFQKIVLADTLLAPATDDVFGAEGPLAALDAWTGVLAFSGQIFCDFAGYSTCAIGLAMCLGFLIPNNFRFPYAAMGFSDFWRRWHITLSSWLRDYLYISMGGNRKGKMRTYINLMITMLLGGLWHGAAWKFVIWGGLHGVYLCIERVLKERFGHVKAFHTATAAIAFVLITNFFVCIAWVFFRADTYQHAMVILRSMFGLASEGAMVLSTTAIVIVVLIYGAIMVSHWLLRHSTHETLVERTPWPVVAAIWAFMIVAIILSQGGGDAFIYFQF